MTFPIKFILAAVALRLGLAKESKGENSLRKLLQSHECNRVISLLSVLNQTYQENFQHLIFNTHILNV